ncbi:MAG: thermonuclease family protein, partial [Hyphomicrobiales bacterium]|nr:thermonuclease family protein [Hyphomicrobiales bacterium]
MPAALAILSAPGAAAGETCDLTPTRTGHVARVIDGRTLVLKSGETVRLTGVLAPEAPAWWKGPGAWGPAARAAQALERLVAGRRVGLAIEPRMHDRHKRLLAHLFIADGPERLWVQGRLVAGGHARAFSLGGAQACMRALQAREARARGSQAGLWRHSWYAIVGAGETAQLARRRYSFQIVEGLIVSVGRTRSWTFLNFGADYKTDFTVAIKARDRRSFGGSDVDLENLAGRRVRVRGWVERWNGPVIKATRPEQIELLAEPGQRQKKNPASL